MAKLRKGGHKRVCAIALGIRIGKSRAHSQDLAYARHQGAIQGHEQGGAPSKGFRQIVLTTLKLAEHLRGRDQVARSDRRVQLLPEADKNVGGWFLQRRIQMLASTT